MDDKFGLMIAVPIVLGITWMIGRVTRSLLGDDSEGNNKYLQAIIDIIIGYIVSVIVSRFAEQMGIRSIDYDEIGSLLPQIRYLTGFCCFDANILGKGYL